VASVDDESTLLSEAPMTGIWQPADADYAASVLAATRPTFARIYDYALGGKDNFEVDRQALHRLAAIAPQIEKVAVANRKWLVRAVRWLARDVGVDQFLDCGSGLPTNENIHEIAQAHNPEAVVIYDDRDPVVLAHGRALLEENDRTHFIGADFRLPEQLLNHDVVRKNLDLERPVALLHGLTLQGVLDLADAKAMMGAYVAALPAGSYVLVTHPFNPHDDSSVSQLAGQVETASRTSFGAARFRDRGEIESLMAGLELVEPGLSFLSEWWPEGPGQEPHLDVLKLIVGVVGRKI
jgi:SAM-dependent methyltransferase